MKRRRRIQGFVLIAFAVVCAGIFVLLLHIAGGTNFGAKYRFDAVVPDAVQLVPEANVREAGVDVGTVTRIFNRGQDAVVGIALNKKYGPIYRDATVAVATKTLVGENYIALNPGDRVSGALPNGGTLPVSQAGPAVQLDQILSVFSPARQAAMRRALAGFGGGLAHSGPQLNQTLDALSGLVSNAAPVAQAISDQSQQLTGLIGNLGSVLTALSQRAAEIHQFVTAGTAAAITVAARNRALKADLVSLPAVLATATRVTSHLASVGTNANPVLDHLGGALADLTPALHALPAAGAATLTALDRLKTVTPIADRLAQALRLTAPSLTHFVPPLAGVVNQLRPLISYLAPYAKDLDSLLYDMNSVGTGADGNSALARLTLDVSSSTVMNLSNQDKALLQALVGSGAAQVVNLKGVNAYPAPGTADNPQPLTTAYPRLKPDTGG
ncbi:MlaD family protein [Conexibacter sp. DBS9H8]|uniref:MlaD family protein n=1 Tax=Conexibacter sp. DBS9H8 TaxID=2937801 RepID=UPI002010263E|nr:MlaD family protein [Conexibacter sp. DBS9H8]